MHIDWATLGIWFLAAIGFFAVSAVLVWVTAWGASGTLPEFVVYIVTQWIFVTGMVRSVSSWSLLICWMVLPALYLLLCVPSLLFSAVEWWGAREGKK